MAIILNKKGSSKKSFELKPQKDKFKLGSVNSKGQMMELPFQLIFSIILIVVFLYAAIVGIRYFLERSEQMQIGQFYVDLESKVNIVWQAAEKSETYSFNLPNSIKKVCFTDMSAMKYNISECEEFEFYRDVARAQGSNTFLCPPEAAYKTGAPVFFKVDCEGNYCLKFPRNPYCVENKDGTVKVVLSKVLGNPNVMLS